jgi:hypothetical protein
MQAKIVIVEKKTDILARMTEDKSGGSYFRFWISAHAGKRSLYDSDYPGVRRP